MGFLLCYNTNKRQQLAAMDAKEYLTIQEVASLLNVHEETIRRYVRAKDLPAIKLRGVYRIRREDFERFLKNRQTE